MINVEQIIHEQFPALGYRPSVFSGLFTRLLRSILMEKEFIRFASDYPHLAGIDFIEQVLESFHFDYQVRMSERHHIPASGPAVIVANHPIGSLDGLAMLKMVHDIRPDVKVVANKLLQRITPLQRLLLPVNNMSGNTSRSHVRAIHTFVQAGGALIIFPAGEVSRMGTRGVYDTRWNSGFLRIATAAKAPIIPVYLRGRNSSFFYSRSFLNKSLSTLWLVREMFKQKHRVLSVRIGDPIPYSTYASLGLDPDSVAGLVRRHTYSLAKRKPPLLKTERAIALPENRQQLRTAVRDGHLLGVTPDGKQIWLHNYEPDSALMREITRLREVSFRAVGEGCGRSRDMDRYDMKYEHMLLWDDEDMEIVGAYRWCPTGQNGVANVDVNQLYTNELFAFNESFNIVLQSGLELGRSFIQPRYWGSRSLDYLWQGIGAYLQTRPDIRYLFGPVSISQSYQPQAMAMVVYFYQHYYGADIQSAEARLPYRLSLDQRWHFTRIFSGWNYQEDFRILKDQLQQLELSVPTLYKQYTGLCENGGVNFVDFNVDPAFAGCVDGLIVLDRHKVKPSLQKRYMLG